MHAGSRYATNGRLDPAPLDAGPHRAAVLDFAASLLGACAASLPSAVVVDVGLASNADRGDEHRAVVEANMAWFSASYAANPDQVLDVVLRAAGPRHRLTPATTPSLARPPLRIAAPRRPTSPPTSALTPPERHRGGGIRAAPGQGRTPGHGAPARRQIRMFDANRRPVVGGERRPVL
ncbi:hypothetical protein ABZU25_22865 [Micromonospora sp. NPDC005215]|uniref:hypothetical protein n=1 Tax=Micromonospora sp. NPDC005215 TaxID=3157024 RepID=UPI0033ADDB1E